MRVRRAIATAVGGCLVGGIAALWLLKFSLGSDALSVHNGPWQTDPAIGSTTAGPLTRARIARIGLLALSHDEAVYYNASTDDQGRPLEAGSRYRVQGSALPARWWSLTVYDAAGYLIPNAADAYSVTSADVSSVHGPFVVELAGKPGSAAHWISTGAGQGRISLTLRLYDPTPGLYSRLGDVSLPSITRVASGEAR